MSGKVRFLAAVPAVLALVIGNLVVTHGAKRPLTVHVQKTDVTGTSSCDCGMWGDVTGDGQLGPLDVAYMANLVYRNLDALVQPPSCPKAAGDANCDDATTPLDMVLYVNLVYRGNAAGWCDNPCAPEGNLVGTSSCKSFQLGQAVAYVSSDSDCVAYDYDGSGILHLTHVNAGFNCCPEPISADIAVETGQITIDEKEGLESGGCDCQCLFDIDYEIVNLPPGEYTITINGLYLLPDEEPLESTVNLAADPFGEYCVFRGHYPWGH